MKAISQHRSLMVECLVVFGGIPLTIAIIKPHSWIYLVLWGLALLAWRAMVRHHNYDFRADWNGAALTRAVIIPIVQRFVPCALGMLAFTWFMIPEQVFSLPRDRPFVWVMVMILYPLLSVVPQEILFRSYFLRRYAKWLPPSMLFIASALAFGWVHIVLRNWVAVVFSMIGGLFFADTYRKTGSLAAICFEHALYGCYLFTIGMGYYFYHGQAVH